MKALTEYSWPGNVRELENVIERLVVTVARTRSIDVERSAVGDPRAGPALPLRPKRERRRTVADDLYKRLIEQRESFWTTVYPLFMDREITRANVREVVRRGLEEARGNYKIVARLFNMEPRDYKRFLNFLRKARLPDSVQGVSLSLSGASRTDRARRAAVTPRMSPAFAPGAGRCPAGAERGAGDRHSGHSRRRSRRAAARRTT